MILTIDEIAKRTKDLPVFNPTAQEVMQATVAQDVPPAKVARLLMKDQSLAIKVLRLANSTYYGLPRRIESLEQAVVILGTRSVRNLALAAATYPWLIRPLKGYNLGPKDLWVHSFAVGMAASSLARCVKGLDPDLALTCGLIHDIGMVTLSLWLESKASALLHFAQRERMPFDEVEQKVLGFDHSQVGALLGDNWNIPESMVSVIRWHHQPDKASGSGGLVDCVHCGVEVVKRLGIGLVEQGIVYRFDPMALHRLGLEKGHLARAGEYVRSNIAEYRQLLEEPMAA